MVLWYWNFVYICDKSVNFGSWVWENAFQFPIERLDSCVYSRASRWLHRDEKDLYRIYMNMCSPYDEAYVFSTNITFESQHNLQGDARMFTFKKGYSTSHHIALPSHNVFFELHSLYPQLYVYCIIWCKRSLYMECILS